MTDDTELLRCFAEEKSETAFAELVQRRIGLVYSVARRHTRNPQHAEDVTQAVFVALARKATELSRRPALVGWLYRSAQFAASDANRAESRRVQREQELYAMQHRDHTAPEPDWEKLRPMLDDVLSAMDERDRDAVLLRFFDGRPFAAIGERLHLSENAARMRVERALEKMHAVLTRSGITSTTAALAVALANQAGAAAPAGLAASVTGGALIAAASVAGTGAAASSAGFWITFMSMSKIQVGIVGALALAGTATYVAQGKSNDGLRRQIAALRGQQQAAVALRAENQQLAATAAEVEVLRRDDVELQQLAQSADEAKKASEENARLVRIRESKRNVETEVARLNREGNALVFEFKALSAKAKDLSLSTEDRAQAQAAAQLKLEAIKAKQNEVNQFKASAAAAGLAPDGANGTWKARGPSPAVEGTINLAKPEGWIYQDPKIGVAR